MTVDRGFLRACKFSVDEAAGIRVDGKDKWLTIIQNASKNKGVDVTLTL